MTTNFSHISVLLQEAVDALNIQPNGIYIDCTFGGGGHSRAILAQLGEKGRLIAFDQDPQAVAQADTIKDARFQIYHRSFTALHAVLRPLKGQINGILFDLGVSSPQLDQANRGFSFQNDGDLDMRMNPTAGEPIANWLHRAKMDEIADVLFIYGEERYSRRLARAIVQARDIEPITRTLQLAEIIKKAHPSWEKHKHPATRSFQALRIFINQEMDALKNALSQTVDLLDKNGRLAAISFHSLEDRLVKRFIRDQAKGKATDLDLPFLPLDHQPTLKAIGKAIYPSDNEIRQNPRSRSAVLRVAEKL
jgi:16S rRNA (cytosine1402-N4)-methyltransferase